MISIVDYGVGNLFSLNSSFHAIGEEVKITADPELIAQSDRIVLPGVGAFSDAIDKLRSSGLDRVILKETAAGKPLLGICLGMQMLLEKSYEYGEHTGLSLIPGAVCPIQDAVSSELKIPHIGWNSLHLSGKQDILFRYVQEQDYVYFVHSYYALTEPQYIIATTEYGKELTAAIRNKNVWGVQFHPEKSGKVGLSILKAFCEM